MSSGTAWTDEPTLSVWIYDSPRGAAAGKVRLERLSQRGAVVVVDVATVTWVRGAHRPRIGRPHVETTFGASRRSPLEMLLGRLLFPSPDLADNARALAREFGGSGLDEDFFLEMGAGFVPDASALLVLSRGADFEEVRVVTERGRARGDVRFMHALLSGDGLSALEALAHRNPAADSWPG
jgi:uncharacterized membrane protein